MKLLTVGDSFTYGEELSNLQLAWPYLLGDKLNARITNLGQPAASNTNIIRKVVNFYYDYDVIVIAWSHYARVEFADERGTYDIWPGSNEAVHDHYHFPHRKQLVQYITRYNDDLYSYQQYLINILLLQDFLKFNNKKYIMVNAFGNGSMRFLQNLELKILIDQVDTTYFLGWPHDQMVEWTWGSPQGPGGHFLEEGHQRVADKIYEYIRYLGWIS